MEKRRTILEQVAKGEISPEAALEEMKEKSKEEKDLCLDVRTGVSRKARVKVRLPLSFVRRAALAAAPCADQESREFLRFLESSDVLEQGAHIQVDDKETGEIVHVHLNTVSRISGN